MQSLCEDWHILLSRWNLNVCAAHSSGSSFPQIPVQLKIATFSTINWNNKAGTVTVLSLPPFCLRHKKRDDERDPIIDDIDSKRTTVLAMQSRKLLKALVKSCVPQIDVWKWSRVGFMIKPRFWLLTKSPQTYFTRGVTSKWQPQAEAVPELWLPVLARVNRLQNPLRQGQQNGRGQYVRFRQTRTVRTTWRRII